MKNMAASPPGLLTFMEAASVASAPFIQSIIVRLRLLLHKMWIGTMPDFNSIKLSRWAVASRSGHAELRIVKYCYMGLYWYTTYGDN
jgi:hypothetical protein